ncbi:hypothetical protein HDU76_005415 [Blyttiomyces sp. JEL0837]|nr:hypothetical protein HDU76_005415 [Blyttiomyces sp. JEL0837]
MSLTPFPTRFQEWSQYLETFKLPCLENFRAELQREASEKAFTFFPVPLHGDESSKTELVLSQPFYDVNRLMFGDICFVSAFDMTDIRRPWIEAGHLHVRKVAKVKSGDGSREDLLAVLTCDAWNLDFDPSEPMFLKCNIYVAVFGSSMPVNRIMRSLADVAGHESLSPVLTETLFNGSQSNAAFIGTEVDFGMPEGYGNLNASQKRAVCQGMMTKEIGGFCLIQGPPGTGKTSTIVVLIAALLQANQIVMQCAPTNIAMLEVAIQFISRYSKHFPRDNIVILGSEQRLSEHIEDKELERFTLPGIIQYYCDSVRSFFDAIGEVAKRIQEHLESSKSYSSALKDEMETLALSTLRQNVTLDRDLMNVFQRMKATIASSFDRKQVDKMQRIFGPFLAAYETQRLLHSETATYSDVIRLQQNFVLHHVRSLLPAVVPDALKNKHESSATKSTSSKKEATKPTNLSGDQLELKSLLESEILKYARVVFCTLNGTMSRQANLVDPSIVIVDEAAQAVEAEMTGILARGVCLKGVVLVGDTKQLPGTVFSELATQVRYQRSLFERLERLGYPKTMLNTQYRMHPTISQFPSLTFYNGALVDGGNVLNYHQSWYNQEEFGSLQFIGHRRTKHLVDDYKSSYNPEEAVMIMSKLDSFFKHNQGPISVGIISLYRAQVDCIQQLLTKSKKYPDVDISVKTVDGFQGQERDLIVVSLTKTERAGRFADDARRMNVGITRAKYGLWVFGDEKAFKDQTSLWSDFYRYCHGFNTVKPFVLNPDDIATVKRLQKTIRTESDFSLDSLITSGSLHNWDIIATNKIRQLLIKHPGIRSLYYDVLEELKTGRFGLSKRPYRKSGLAGRIFYNRRIDGQSVLVWTIGVRDAHQVILLLDHGSKTTIDQIFTKFCEHMHQYSDEYLGECSTLDISSGAMNVARPRYNISAPVLNSIKTPFDAIARDVSNSAKLYDLSSSEVLNRLAEAEDESDESFRLMLPYLLDEHQAKAVGSSESMLIIGRGGCGKTSILARKLFNLYEATLNQDLPQFSQLFVSQSRLLVTNVRAEYLELVKELHQLKNIPYDDPPADSHLPARLPKVEFGEQGSCFLSFMDLIFKMDQVLGNPRLFQDDESEINAVRARLIGERWDTSSTTASKFAVTMDEVIDSHLFQSVYYSFASHQLQRAFSAHFLFTEIMNEIGFLEASGVKRVLSQKEYTSKLRVGLSESDREDIYKFFVRYQREKVHRKHLDLLDIAASIIARKANMRVRQDVIFVDEVQDLMPCQWRLFNLLMTEGTRLVCSGDQAQAITGGTSFRFSNLKKFLYDCTGHAPEETLLTINYRTDQHILSLSNRVLDILRFFFKEDLDTLPEEVAARQGEGFKPVLFTEQDSHEALSFLFKETTDFSSEQAILVLSKDQKRHVQELQRDGTRLEFNDVVLYNPFESESLYNTNRMRVLYQFDKPESEQGGLPQFDFKTHFSLCLHLKELYVGVTRAKSRLLIIDDSHGREIFQHLLRDHVTLTSVDAEVSFSSKLDATFEIQQWEVRGHQFKSQRLWPEALRAFKLCGNKVEELKVRVCMLMEEYHRTQDKKAAKKAAEFHLELASLFDEQQGESKEEKVWNLKEAAKIFEKGEFFNQAADCFKTLNQPERVLDCYVRGSSFDNLLSSLKQYHDILYVQARDYLYELAAKHFYGIQREKGLACLSGISNPERGLDFLESRFGTINREDLFRWYDKYKKQERGIKFCVGRGLLPVVGMVFVQEESPVCSVDQLVANPCLVLKVVQRQVIEMEDAEARNRYITETAEFFFQRRYQGASLFEHQGSADYKKLFRLIAAMVKSQKSVSVKAFILVIELELGLPLSSTDEERDIWISQLALTVLDSLTSGSTSGSTRTSSSTVRVIEEALDIILTYISECGQENALVRCMVALIFKNEAGNIINAMQLVDALSSKQRSDVLLACFTDLIRLHHMQIQAVDLAVKGSQKLAAKERYKILIRALAVLLEFEREVRVELVDLLVSAMKLPMSDSLLKVAKNLKGLSPVNDGLSRNDVSQSTTRDIRILSYKERDEIFQAITFFILEKESEIDLAFIVNTVRKISHSYATRTILKLYRIMRQRFGYLVAVNFAFSFPSGHRVQLKEELLAAFKHIYGSSVTTYVNRNPFTFEDVCNGNVIEANTSFSQYINSIIKQLQCEFPGQKHLLTPQFTDDALALMLTTFIEDDIPNNQMLSVKQRLHAILNVVIVPILRHFNPHQSLIDLIFQMFLVPHDLSLTVSLTISIQSANQLQAFLTQLFDLSADAGIYFFSGESLILRDIHFKNTQACQQQQNVNGDILWGSLGSNDGGSLLKSVLEDVILPFLEGLYEQEGLYDQLERSTVTQLDCLREVVGFMQQELVSEWEDI